MEANDSLYKKSRKRQSEAVLAILNYMATVQDVDTKNIIKETKFSAKTVNVELGKLEKINFVKLVGTHESSKRGIPMNVWRLRFPGILAIFCWHQFFPSKSQVLLKFNKQPSIEKMIKNYKDHWIVFKIWDFMLANLYSYPVVVQAIQHEFRDNWWSNPERFALSYNTIVIEAERQLDEIKLREINADDYYDRDEAFLLHRATLAGLLLTSIIYQGGITKYTSRAFGELLKQESVREWITMELDHIEQQFTVFNDIKRELEFNKPEK